MLSPDTVQYGRVPRRWREFRKASRVWSQARLLSQSWNICPEAYWLQHIRLRQADEREEQLPISSPLFITAQMHLDLRGRFQPGGRIQDPDRPDRCTSFSGVIKLLPHPVGVARNVPSGSFTDTLPSLAATQPSCHILWQISQICSLNSIS